MRLILLLACIYSVLPRGEAQIPLQRWEYCAGCRAAVESFSSKIFPLMNNALERRGVTDKMDLEPYTEGICQTDTFRLYKESIEHGCLNLLQTQKELFLEAFDGEDLHEQAQRANPTKGNFFKMTKKICIPAMACSPRVFKKPAPTNKRSQCDACVEIGEQLELMKMIIYDPNINKEIVNTICGLLGYNYSPFAWLEEHCEDIMEEHSSEVVRILERYSQDAKTDISGELCNLLQCRSKQDQQRDL